MLFYNFLVKILIFIILGIFSSLYHKNNSSLIIIIILSGLIACYFFYTRFKFISLTVGLYTLMLAIVIFIASWSYTSFQLKLAQSQIDQLKYTHGITTIRGYINDIPHLKNNQYYVRFVVTNGHYQGHSFIIFYKQNQTNWLFRAYYQLTVNLNHNQAVLTTAPIIIGSRYSLLAYIGQLRLDMFNYINNIANNAEFKGVFLSLILGDHDYISTQQWQLFSSLGIIHLITISGLHINIIYYWWRLIAVRVYKFTILYGWRFASKKQKLWLNPASFISATTILVVLYYGCFTGLSVPIKRALGCIILIEFSNLFKFYLSKIDALLITCTIVLLSNPNTLNQGGAWISFMIIFVIFYLNDKYAEWNYVKRKILLQLIICCTVLPLSVWFFDSIPWFSLPVNLIAIPILGDLLTPCLFIASIMHLDFLLLTVMKLITYFLHLIKTVSFVEEIPYHIDDLKIILLSYTGLWLIITPSVVNSQKTFGLLLFCSLFFNDTSLPNSKLTVIAVVTSQSENTTSQSNLTSKKHLYQVDIALIYQHKAYIVSDFIAPNNHSVLLQNEKNTIMTLLKNYKIYKIQYLTHSQNLDIGNYQLNLSSYDINNRILTVYKKESPITSLVIANNFSFHLNQYNKINTLIYLNDSNKCQFNYNIAYICIKQIYLFNSIPNCFNQQADNFYFLDKQLIDGMKNHITIFSIN